MKLESQQITQNPPLALNEGTSNQSFLISTTSRASDRLYSNTGGASQLGSFSNPSSNIQAINEIPCDNLGVRNILDNQVNSKGH